MVYYVGMDIDADALSFYLRKFRRSGRWTMRHLSDLTGNKVSQATIFRLEDGELTTETERFIPPLATALDVPIDKLIRWPAGKGPGPTEDFRFLGPALPAGADPNQGAEGLINEDQFFVQVLGDCLEPDIEAGTYLLMSRTKSYGINDVVLVRANGEFHLKRVVKRNGVTELSSKRGRLVAPPDEVEFRATMIRPLR